MLNGQGAGTGRVAKQPSPIIQKPLKLAATIACCRQPRPRMGVPTETRQHSGQQPVGAFHHQSFEQRHYAYPARIVLMRIPAKSAAWCLSSGAPERHSSLPIAPELIATSARSTRWSHRSPRRGGAHGGNTLMDHTRPPARILKGRYRPGCAFAVDPYQYVAFGQHYVYAAGTG